MFLGGPEPVFEQVRKGDHSCRGIAHDAGCVGGAAPAAPEQSEAYRRVCFRAAHEARIKYHQPRCDGRVPEERAPGDILRRDLVHAWPPVIRFLLALLLCQAGGQSAFQASAVLIGPALCASVMHSPGHSTTARVFPTMAGTVTLDVASGRPGSGSDTPMTT